MALNANNALEAFIDRISRNSNIMNILFILGASSTIHPIAATSQNIIDTFVLIGVSLLIYGIAKKGDTMTRKKGIFVILVYVIYMIYIIVR